LLLLNGTGLPVNCKISILIFLNVRYLYGHIVDIFENVSGIIVRINKRPQTADQYTTYVLWRYQIAIYQARSIAHE